MASIRRTGDSTRRSGDSTRRSALRDDRRGEPRDAHERVVGGADLDAPDVRRATEMNRPRDARDDTVADTAHVVRVDVEPHARGNVRIDAADRGSATERLREQHGGTAVQ